MITGLTVVGPIGGAPPTGNRIPLDPSDNRTFDKTTTDCIEDSERGGGDTGDPTPSGDRTVDWELGNFLPVLFPAG